MKKYNLILTASLIVAFAVSAAAFAGPKKAELPRVVQTVKAHEKVPARFTSTLHEPKGKAFAAKREVKQKAPVRPAPMKPTAKKAAHVTPQKLSHQPSKASDIIAIAAALLRLSS